MIDHQRIAPLLTPEKTSGIGHLEKNDVINRILSVSLKNQLRTSPQTNIKPYYWDETRFNLNCSSLFQTLTDEKKQRILTELSLHSLYTSYFIEKLAISFCSKMVLLSETIEEKALYTIIGAEEVYHWKEFTHFLELWPEDSEFKTGLLDSLQAAIQDADRLTSMYIGQILLEGFGMFYYSGLKETTIDNELKKVYERILEDEGRHHGSALCLFERGDKSKLDWNQIIDKTHLVIKQVLSLDLHLLKTIENTTGTLDEEQRVLFFKEIKMKEILNERARRVKQMMLKDDTLGLLAELEKRSSFTIERHG